jgi:hypothetical protein
VSGAAAGISSTLLTLVFVPSRYGLKADINAAVKSGAISEMGYVVCRRRLSFVLVHLIFLRTLSLALSTWREQLAPALSITSHSDKNALPHILMMHLASAWLTILLYRPFYRPTVGRPAAPPSICGEESASNLPHVAAVKVRPRRWHVPAYGATADDLLPARRRSTVIGLLLGSSTS